MSERNQFDCVKESSIIMIGTLYKDMRFVGVARLSDYVDRRAPRDTSARADEQPGTRGTKCLPSTLSASCSSERLGSAALST